MLRLKKRKTHLNLGVFLAISLVSFSCQALMSPSELAKKTELEVTGFTGTTRQTTHTKVNPENFTGTTGNTTRTKVKPTNFTGTTGNDTGTKPLTSFFTGTTRPDQGSKLLSPTDEFNFLINRETQLGQSHLKLSNSGPAKLVVPLFFEGNLPTEENCVRLDLAVVVVVKINGKAHSFALDHREIKNNQHQLVLTGLELGDQIEIKVITPEKVNDTSYFGVVIRQSSVLKATIEELEVTAPPLSNLDPAEGILKKYGLVTGSEYDINFIAENLPDNTSVQPGKVETKEWTLFNPGPKEWINFTLKDVSPLDSPQLTPLKEGVKLPTVAPGEFVTVSMPFKVPQEPNVYRNIYKLFKEDGSMAFPDLHGVYVQVQVKGDLTFSDIEGDEAKLLPLLRCKDGLTCEDTELFPTNYQMELQSDVTHPEKIKRADVFVKVRIQNVGSRNWVSRKWVYREFEQATLKSSDTSQGYLTPLNASKSHPWEFEIPLTLSGQTAEIIMHLQSPNAVTQGMLSHWEMRDRENRRVLSELSQTLSITVEAPRVSQSCPDNKEGTD